MMSDAIAGFRRHWEFLHSMTLAFVAEVPADHWEFSPHPRFAPFAKQLRHVVSVRGVYNDGLVTGQIDFSRKHAHYGGGLGREELTAGLIEKHERLLGILDDMPGRKEEACVEAFGKEFPFAEFSHVMVQHEAIHQGQWSLYASLAGFETPLIWRLNWAL